MGRRLRTCSDAGDPADELRGLVHGLVRAAGELTVAATPGGPPLGASHAHALTYLLGAEAEGRPPTQRALGAALSIDKSNVTRLCVRMAALGHLEQCRCGEDGRARRLRLTPEGVRAAEAVLTASRARFGAILAALPAEGRPEIVAALEALVAAMRAVPLAGPSPARVAPPRAPR